jgi:hypothetical protein
VSRQDPGAWLADLGDNELRALAAELEERAELFGPQTRMQVNDELRHRRMLLVGQARPGRPR